MSDTADTSVLRARGLRKQYGAWRASTAACSWVGSTTSKRCLAS